MTMTSHTIPNANRWTFKTGSADNIVWPQHYQGHIMTTASLPQEMLPILLANLTDHAIFMIDENGHVVNWNKGAEKIEGYQAEEIIGQHISVFYTPEQVAASQPQRDLDKVAAAGSLEWEGRRVRKGGSQFWAEVKLIAVRDAEGRLRGFSKIVHDVTTRKQAAQASIMAESAVNAMIMVDLDGRIVMVNNQTEKLFGYERAELIGRSVEILVPERFRDHHPAYREAYITAPTIRPMGAGRDLYGRRKDGSEFPIEIGLNPVDTDQGRLILSSIVDITERKRADEKFRMAVESAPNAMVMVNQEGRISLANLQAERLFGYSREELIDQHVEILVPERMRSLHSSDRRTFFEMPTARAMGSGRELYGRRKDGTECPVEIGLNPIQTEDGLFVLSAIVDITHRKELEVKARERLAELAHMARLTTIGEMISGLAHELNQPLGAAANYARASVRLAKNNLATLEELTGWMEKAAIESNRACEIVSRMAQFVKKDVAPPSLVDLNQTVEYVVELAGANLGRDVARVSNDDLKTELASKLPPVLANRVQIEQVLVNLVRNAYEAMQDREPLDRHLTIRTDRAENMVRVAVSDSGPGIAPEYLPRLFKPFFTTKRNGMGLGLSISRSIVEAHGGELTVASTVGKGTTFAITLPVAGQETSK